MRAEKPIKTIGTEQQQQQEKSQQRGDAHA